VTCKKDLQSISKEYKTTSEEIMHGFNENTCVQKSLKLFAQETAV
jgi:hypothetical protein